MSIATHNFARSEEEPRRTTEKRNKQHEQCKHADYRVTRMIKIHQNLLDPGKEAITKVSSGHPCDRSRPERRAMFNCDASRFHPNFVASRFHALYCLPVH